MNTSNKKTVVLGATPNPARYAYAAVLRLQNKGHEVVAVGNKKGAINGSAGCFWYAVRHRKPFSMGEIKSPTPYYDYILSLNPKRIIFNPGAENIELARLAEEKGIEIVYACTLVMLSIGDY